MARFTDYTISPEVTDIMEAILEAYPGVFQGFDLNMLGCIITKKKKSRKPIRLIPVGYPRDVYCDKAYIVEVFEKLWNDLSQKKKNLAVFHIMCSIPEGGFDESSKQYAKKRKPDYELYAEEFAVAGGIPNWMENDDAKDVFDDKQKKEAKQKKEDSETKRPRAAITKESIENVEVKEKEEELVEA